MTGPNNPFLAASTYPIGHGRCDQQDSSPGRGPEGPTETLSEAAGDISYAPVGPSQFGSATSGQYADGRRVLWGIGREEVVKIDYDTFEIVARLTLPGKEPTSVETAEQAVADLDAAILPGVDPKVGVDLGITLAFQYLMGLDGVYYLLDVDHTFYVGTSAGAIAFRDEDPTDAHSPIVEHARWTKPDNITGDFVGVNMTFDGRLVMSTGDGWLVALARDFSDFDAIALPGYEAAPDFNQKTFEERGNKGYTWVRTSMCVDEDNAIYISSVDHTHKVCWTGERLSLDEADGAWSAPYRNGTGLGSGTTPCLMGFGDDDRFVVIGDGDDVVNITLLWRDNIPEDWEQLADAPSRRIAGLGPANMGDPDLPAIQTEQSITVAGYGAMTVNNEPASIPDGFPNRGQRLLVGYLGATPAYTPKGLHKYEWNPTTRTLGEAWVNQDVSSPNAVPFVSEGSDLVYTVGARDGQWTIEAVNWSTGQESFHWVLGGNRYNSLFAGVKLDEDGRIVVGTAFGKIRIERPAG